VTGRRSIVSVLATAALALPVGPAWAQSGAGDDQYTDPFADEQAQQARPRQRQAQQQPGEDDPGLSEQPPVTPPTTTTPPTTPEPAEPAPEEAAELPNTGYEIPAIALLGLGLLVSGIGLRLRTVDDTLF
jgi:LPXTG-motif cell wall-anchored protein